jgi:hypothetical protein
MSSPERKPLPGELPTRDAKGHTQFECFLCGDVSGIFGGSIIGKWRVCHRCQIDLVHNACKAKETAT